MRRSGWVVPGVVMLGVLGWSGVAWAHCPEHGDTCPSDALWLMELGTMDDRSFAVFDWGMGGMVLDDQFAEVFDGSSLGMTMRMGAGFDRLAGLLTLSVQELDTPLYEPLSMLTVGMEGRWYLPLHDELGGFRVWVSGGVGMTWLTGCEEDSDCVGSGDPALTDYSGQMASLGVGASWFMEGGFLGFFVEARVERQRLRSEALQRGIEGDVTVINIGMINELSWAD